MPAMLTIASSRRVSRSSKFFCHSAMKTNVGQPPLEFRQGSFFRRWLLVEPGW